MFSWFVEFFKGDDDNDPSFIRVIRNILIFVLVINAALLPLVSGYIGEDSRDPVAFFTLIVNLILEGIALYLLVNRGNVIMAKVVVPTALIITIVIVSLSTNGLKNTSIAALPIVLVISAILMGTRFFAVAIPLSIFGVAIISYFDLNDRIPYVPSSLDDVIILPLLLLGCAGIIQLLLTRLNDSIKRAQHSEEIQRRENIELSQLRTTLEERVNMRTTELDIANQNNSHRAKQFEAVAQVTRAISSIQELGTLLSTITDVISQQFGHYHTGIFLIDEQREFAVLRAANSDGGKAMIINGHKVPVGQTGIIGFVTATGQPRIALDAGSDAVYFDNPFLPNTHSEIAIPLRAGGQITGALNIQSEQSNAFSENDIEVLTTLADQVSIAIQNTKTLDDAKKSLAEAQIAISRVTQEAWKVLQPEKVGLGFTLISGQSIKPLETPLDDDIIHEALAKGQTTSSKTNDAETITIPIRLRNEVIGVMNLKIPNDTKITSDDVDIAEAVTERLSLAIETATLLETSRRRADIERLTTDISAQVNSSTRFDSILKTTAEELSRALGSEVIVQIDPVSLQLSAGEN